MRRVRPRETALAVCLAAHVLGAFPAFSATFTVTTTADAGAGSLRVAIASANASPGADTILFGVSGTIAPITELPAITEPVLIDGGGTPNTDPTITNAVITVVLDGTNTLDRGLLVTANNVRIRGLSLVRFRNAAIEVRGNDNTVEGSFFGVLPDGTTAARNTFDGISIRSGSGNHVGGPLIAQRNLISGNRTGVRISFPAYSSFVWNNLFGVDRTGSVRIENEGGVVIGDALGNTVLNNLISGSLYEGVELAHYALQNVVQDNVIGLNAAQTAAITNDQHGIKLGAGASDNTVERNLIAGNRSGIALWDSCTSFNRIRENTIGHATIPNTEYGIELRDAADNSITGNDVLFNGFSGISMIVESGGAVPKRNLVRDNDVTDNVGEGINLWLPGNFVEENRVLRNQYGIRLRFAATTGNVVEGNTIDDNDAFGVWIQAAEGNTLRRNTITNNGAQGIAHGAGNGDRFTANVIEGNTGAIDLNLDGPTANDAGDGDDGPNRLQNYPALTAASRTPAATSVSGTLDALPGTYTVEFFSADAATDARDFLGARTVTAGVPFTFTDLEPTTHEFITATATSDATNDTSELSPGISAKAQEPIAVPALPAVRVDDVNVLEGGDVVFTIAVEPSADTITVDYITVDETALDGADYTGDGGTVTFDPGETEQTVTIATTDDATSETNETFVLSLTGATNASLADVTGRAFIRDNDFAFSISDVSIAEGESGDAIVTITPAPTRPLQTFVSYVDLTTTSADYVPPQALLEIAPCQTEYRLRLTTLEDLLDESDEQFQVTLAPPEAHVGDGTGIVTILDNDLPPVITVDDDVVSEGGSASFTVRLSTPSGLEVRVDAATEDGTATTADYMATATTVIFPPGTTEQTVNVLTSEDVLDEADETFSLVLGNPQNGVFGDRTGVATILDDDLSADLTITKTASVDRAPTGATVDYEIVVRNDGPGPAIDVVVTDTLPAGATLVSASPSCTGTSTGAVCNLGDLTSGQQATITLRVILGVQPSVNTATVTAATTDPNGTNDTATAAIAGLQEVPALSTIGLIAMLTMLGWLAMRRTS